MSCISHLLDTLGRYSPSLRAMLIIMTNYKVKIQITFDEKGDERMCESEFKLNKS